MAGMRPAEMARRIDQYTQENREGLPILKECCLMNGWDYNAVIKKAAGNETLKKAVRRLLCQKEVNLEKGGILGDFNRSMTALLLREISLENQREREFDVLDKLDRTLLCEAELASLAEPEEPEELINDG
jgi:hypothetical protein